MSSPVDPGFPKVRAVFDIDGVLCCEYLLRTEPFKGGELFQFFQKRGAVLEISTGEGVSFYTVPPGVIEFIELLSKTQGVSLSIFSSGSEERNREFANQLLRRAHFNDETIGRVQVFSRQHLKESTEAQRLEHEKLYGFSVRAFAKDLLQVLRDGERIEDTILVEDFPVNVAPGQAKNVLHVESSDECDFIDMHRRRPYSQDEYDKIFFSVNRIYFVAGLFFQALEKARKENLSITEALFRKQFLQKETSPGVYIYKLNRQIHKDMELYRYGLKRLQEINPALGFTMPQQVAVQPKEASDDAVFSVF